MKIRENRLRVLRQMTEPRWYMSSELDAELFLLSRMAEEGLLDAKFENIGGKYVSRFRAKETLQGVCQLALAGRGGKRS